MIKFTIIKQSLAYKTNQVDPKAKPGTDLSRNIKRLQQVTQDALKAIYNSVDHCPR